VWAAAEASSLPRGGVSLVAQATGLSRTTIHAGIRELQQRKAKPLEAGRSRRAGGGVSRSPFIIQTAKGLGATGGAGSAGRP